jgi:uncharacterized protein YecE (DUF72 family)
VALCLHDWKEQPVTGPVTADFVYVRRHGTRRRYGGSYTERMLRQDAAQIRAWRRQGRAAVRPDRAGAIVSFTLHNRWNFLLNLRTCV